MSSKREKLNVELDEKQCTGRKLEDGERCKGSKASYSLKYCEHHVDVLEVLIDIWVQKISEAIYEFANEKEDIDVIESIWQYVNGYINWAKGISNEKPWYYPYNAVSLKRAGKDSDKCTARLLKDGTECKNITSERNDQFCRCCTTIRRVLYKGYKIAEYCR